MKEAPFLEVRNVTKRFPGVLALNRVNLRVYPGRVLALVGENGAGKSTLMKILSGVRRADGGEILISGNRADIPNPMVSRQLGISVIFQELSVLDNLDIAENIFVGREKRKRCGLADRAGQHAEAAELLQRVGLTMDTRVKVARLSTAQKQLVEVAKALSLDSRLIIMDEPTSSLTEAETARLMEIIRRLCEKGVAVVFISHRMNEVFEIADDIAIMRDGEIVRCVDAQSVTESEVISAMVGRDVSDVFSKRTVPVGDVALDVRRLSTRGLLKDISFRVRSGEIVGFAGLMGSGRSEVMRALFGIEPKLSGEIRIDGKTVRIDSPIDAIRAGLGFVPEDRQAQGLILKMSVRANASIAAIRSVASGWFIRKAREKALCEKYMDMLRIKTASQLTNVQSLSGGNQQKVVIAKWLAIKPRVLILDEPTRGIDVGAKKEIHALMNELAGQGVAIVMISSELPEILGMSDRVYVMHEGRLKGELTRENASQEAIMRMAVS